MMSSPLSPSPTFSSSPSLPSESDPTTFSSKSSLFLRKPNSLSYSPSLCTCRSSSSNSPSPAPSSPFQQFFAAAAEMLDSFMNSGVKKKEGGVEVEVKERENVEEEEDEWDWERWVSHFQDVDDQDRFISLLKSQIYHAIEKEDYEDAARLKVAIAAASSKDAVGSAMSYLKNAIEEERYTDAVFVRDNAGAGLVGWWAGISDDKNDPYGCIIRISPEHGRYVARSYSPRQLASSTTGAPLFEIFVTMNKKDEYRQQAVYLKRKTPPDTVPSVFPKSAAASGSMKMSPDGDKTDIFAPIVEDNEDDEDKDDQEIADGFSGFQNILQDMIPGVRVKVLKVTTSDNVDQDLISRVVDQIIDEEEEDDDEDIEAELDGVDTEDTEDGVPSESDDEKDESEGEAPIGELDREEQSEVAVKVVVRGLVQKLSGTASSKDFVRVPAKLKSKGRKAFSFSVQDDEDQLDSAGKGLASPKTKGKAQGQRKVDHVMTDLVNSISRGEKVPVKVLKDIGDLLSVSISQAQNRQPLSGSTTFNRIDLPAYPDPLNGLYIGSHGPYTSEVIHLKRKFGQWKEKSGTDGTSDLNFYEYVEAVKLTGDPYVPAGQVAFRAKIGKRYQLPHKGIIPEEFGVVARYKGQGRLSEPGFKKPRWVDGELVILDGKYIKSGHVVGFVYWAPEYQFLVFFNRLRIQD